MSTAARQYPLPLPHNEAMEAHDFMATSSNSEAIAWIERWPDWPAHCLVIYGPSGSGKTHLMNVWLSRSGGATKTNDTIAASGASGGAFAIDDADQAAGNAAREEALFHFFNRLRDTKGSLLLTARNAPAQWNIQLPDLRSRLASIPAVAIKGPDDELISALLIKQFRDRQIDLGADVLDYLLSRIERSPAAIRKLVTDLDRASLAEGRKITVALARRLLETAYIGTESR